MTEYLSALISAKFLAPYAFWSLLVLLPLLLLDFLKKKRGLMSLLLRAVSVVLLVTALADPIRVKSSSSEQIAALIDVSYSVSSQARTALLDQLEQFRGDDDLSISLLPFARKPARVPIAITGETRTAEIAEAVAEQVKALDTGETDIGAALDALISRTSSSSILLLSDGFETTGDARQIARKAAGKGIRIFPVLPSDKVFRNEKLSISSLHVPITVDAGDKALIRTSIKNSFDIDSEADVEIWLKDKLLATKRISVPAGEERLVAIKTDTLKGGLHRVRAVLKPLDADTEAVERHRWLSVKEKSKILLISGKKSDQVILKEFIRLKGYGLENVIANGKQVVPSSLLGFSSVILNNVSKAQLPSGFLNKLKEFVTKGGGLLLLGGDRSFGLGNYINTPLEEISPVKFVPPKTEKRRLIKAIVLVVDKSGSMVHQGKIQAAKQAAMMSIDALKDDDYISLIGFDHAPFVIIDLERVRTAKSQAKRRLENLTAAGRTNLLPALAAARQKLRSAKASRKHIIVLSDGKFPLESDAYVEEINRLRKNGVTVSAVALGIEADVPFMKLLSKYGKGAFYHTLDPSRLPQIFVNDIKVSTGEKTLAENKNYAIGLGPNVTSTSFRRFPPLKGFVETLPKESANLELITKARKKLHPILASWKYGKGQVVAFTSDVSPRWSLPWLKWKKFPPFWTEIIEKIKDRSGNKAGELDFDLRYSVNRKAISLDLAIYDDNLRSNISPKISAEIIEPGGELKRIIFRPLKKGRFEGSIENGRPGDYTVNISYGNLKLPPLALTLGGESFGEIPGRGLNVQNLEDLAYLTSGVINPYPEQVKGQTRILEENEHLYLPLLIVAFFLILLEAFVREIGFSGLAFFRKAPRVTASTLKPQGKYHATKRAA